MKLRVTGTFGGGRWDPEVHMEVVGLPHAQDADLYIFAKHSSDGHTKMSAFRIQSAEATPVLVEGRFHLKKRLPIDAVGISDTWDTAGGRADFDKYKVTDIKCRLRR